MNSKNQYSYDHNTKGNQQPKIGRKPLQIEIIDDQNLYERKNSSDNILVNEQQSYSRVAENKQPIHRLKNQSNYRMKNTTQQSDKDSQDYNISISENNPSNTKMNHMNINQMEQRIMMLQQQLKKEKQQKMELYMLVNQISKKKEQIQKAFETQRSRAEQVETLHHKINTLKKINRKLQTQIDEQRQYSKKLENEMKEVINYKKTGMKAQTYLQKQKLANDKNKQNRESQPMKHQRMPREKSIKNLKINLE